LGEGVNKEKKKKIQTSEYGKKEKGTKKGKKNPMGRKRRKESTKKVKK